MVNSILDSVKKNLMLDASYTAFDVDVITHINAVFSTLEQLGVGPEGGYMIEDSSATWDAFLGGDPRLNNIKTYVFLRVRLLFDPPTVGYHVEAVKEQIKELEWRINVRREDVSWVDPDPEPLEDETVIDGGSP